MEKKEESAWPGFSLNLRNFKAFKNSGEIKFAPITLVFGENSVGKSSIIQALLSQTDKSTNPHQSGLALKTEALSIRSFNQIAGSRAKKFSISTTEGLPGGALLLA